MQYKWAVIDRLADGDRYDDPRKIVSRHATHEAAERAAKRLGCGDRYAIIDYERRQALTHAASSLGRLGGLRRTPAKAAAARTNGGRGGRHPRVIRDPERVIGEPASAVDRYDWMDCYPVIDGRRIVGVVSALSDRAMLAGVGGGVYDEERQAFVRE